MQCDGERKTSLFTSVYPDNVIHPQSANTEGLEWTTEAIETINVRMCVSVWKRKLA